MGGVTELISRERIAERVHALASQIAVRHGGTREDDLVVVALLKGAFMFASDLLRALDEIGVHPQIDFLTVSSYGSGTESSGTVKVQSEPQSDLQGRDVLLVDDLLDSGRSLAFARGFIEERGARRVETCVLLDKPDRRVVDVRPDYVGFEIPNRFVVGYGVDWAERYRHLPYIGVVDSH